jgi:DNA-directed RNA polymerase subunit RPC12/RpoP
MSEDKRKPRESIFRALIRRRSQAPDQPKTLGELSPAMPELGIAPCPVCGHKVAVLVTRTKRPFINCGFCSARIFYNGSRSQRLLQKQIEPIEDSEDKGSLGALIGFNRITGGKND